MPSFAWLDVDRWQEVFESIRRNRLRALLTSLAVAWGIFMLVVLLGAGNGLRNGINHLFRDDAVNSIWVSPGKTTKPFRGRAVGRSVRFTNDDHDAVAKNLPVDHISSRFHPGDQVTVTYRDQHAAFDIRAVHPDHRYLENTQIIAGRFLDNLDLANKRKVAVIGTEVAKALFRGRDPLGQRIDIGGLPHDVIGVFDDEGGEDERRKIYVPITTAQLAWSGGRRVDRMIFTFGAGDVAESKRIVEETRRLLASRHGFAPGDLSAVNLRNNLERFERIAGVIDGIGWFVWFIGAGTIVAGIVGVSNIMLISVKERTREIGLRKALGATPTSIISLVLSEAILLTATAGYVGLVAGIVVLETVSRLLPASDYFRDPEVHLGTALAATAVLIVCGALAGFFPARRAARVSPVVALRDE